MYKYFHLVNQVSYLYCISTISTINHLTKQIANFLYTASINLRSVKCIIYGYISDFIYFNGIDLAAAHTRFVFKPSQESIEDIFHMIRRKLYHKNSRNLWRINNFPSVNGATLYVQNLLYRWQIYYCCILSDKDIMLMHRLTDSVLYTWQMKK